jgi:hypothetical protein
MIKNFSQYLVEEEREVYFTFGRMNPPTIGHGKVMDTLAKKSGKADYKVFLSQSTNPKKDPLSYTDKIKHVRKMFPKHARNVMMDKGVKNVFDVAAKLYEQGYKRINMVVGADRITEFETLLNKYNGTKARHGFYKFEKINVISAGERDPDASGVEGMSASKQRANAAANDFVTFAQGVPKSMSNADARKLFNDVRKGMGLKETKEFKNHFDMGIVSETREDYVRGDLYKEGDLVIVKETNVCAEVKILGSNYVIIETADGAKHRKWLDAIEPIIEKTKTRQDPDIADKKGTQPARYHAGLSKSTKDKRDAHFKKHGKKSDDDASAYKPAPGDKDAETKPSKYTKSFKDMYEEVSQRQIQDLEKFGDRLLNKFDIDIEFTRHFADRMNDTRNKPEIKVAELQKLFKKIAKQKGSGIKKHANAEVVLKDIQTDLNLPVAIKLKNGEFEVVNKTIMRKKDFKTSNPEIKYESTELEEMHRWMMDIVGDKLNPKNYKSALEVLTKLLDRKKKESGGKLKHSVEYYALTIGRQYKGVDARVLADLYRKSVKEEVDPVQTARDAIDREKEADKKKHDRILDRARLARAKQKNRETK